MKKSKEQLVIELDRVSQENNGLINGDLYRRKEFAKAFGWTNSNNSYFRGEDNSNPTWPEIFVELGKLLADRKQLSLEGNLRQLEQRFDLLTKDLEKKLTNPQ